MKRYIPVVAIIATVLFLGTALKSENVVQQRDNCQLVVNWTDYSNGYAAACDYPVYPKVYGTVYLHSNPKNGAIAILTHEDGDEWQDTTQGGGQYDLRCPHSGWYNIRACYLGECSPQYEFYIRPYSFDQVHIDLCIGRGGPCPLPIYK